MSDPKPSQQMLTDSIEIDKKMCEPETQRNTMVNRSYCIICSQLLPLVINDVHEVQAMPDLIYTEEMASVNGDLDVMFVLKLLNFPSEKSAHILEKTPDLTPGQWFLLCSPCCKKVEKVFSLERKFAKLNQQLTKLKSVITNKVVKSLEKEEYDKEQKLNSRCDIPKYIRGFLKNESPRFKVVETDKDSDEDTVYSTEEDTNWVSSDGDSLDDDDMTPSSSTPQLTLRTASSCDKTSPVSEVTTEAQRRQNTSAPKSKRVPKNQKYECILCPFTTTRTKLLRRHQKVHEEVKIYRCDICDAAFTSKTNFELHMRKHRKDMKQEAQGTIKCGKCDFISTTNYQAEMHTSTHVEEFVDVSQAPDKFTCKICQKSCDTKTAAKQHVSKEHKSELGATLLQCDMCPNSYISEQNLRNHIRQFHKMDECRHRCDQCGLGFISRIKMEDHRAKHFNDGEPHLVCDLCGLKFASHQGMRNHKKKYHPEKGTDDKISTSSAGKSQGPERNCSHCDAVCVNLRGLKEHWRAAHPEMYKFKCDLCDAAYISGENLKIHVRCAHLKEKVECDKCGAKMSCASIKDHNRKYCKFR